MCKVNYSLDENTISGPIWHSVSTDKGLSIKQLENALEELVG